MTEQWGQPEVRNQTLLEVLSSPLPTNSLYLFAAASFVVDILFFPSHITFTGLSHAVDTNSSCCGRPQRPTQLGRRPSCSTE